LSEKGRGFGTACLKDLQPKRSVASVSRNLFYGNNWTVADHYVKLAAKRILESDAGAMEGRIAVLPLFIRARGLRLMLTPAFVISVFIQGSGLKRALVPRLRWRTS
jgi:hypothetical protein